MSDERVERLERLCAELYQIIGEIMFTNEGLHDSLLPIMDALSAAQNGLPLKEGDLLPWHLPQWAYEALQKAKP